MKLLRPPLGDPAAEAARFLQRLALVILMIAAPLSEVLSHGTLYVLLPVGAGILVVAGLLVGNFRAPQRFLFAALTPIGIAVAFLTFWSALSLVWTPFPGEAAPRLGRTLLTGGIVMLAIFAQPERTKISNIYLLPIGVALTAAATLLMILVGPSSFWQGSNPDYTFAQRCVMSVTVLLWPAIGALALRDHFIMAAALAVLVAAASLAAFNQPALAAFMIAAVAYAAATVKPSRVARIAGYGTGALLLAAPLVAALLDPLATILHLPLGSPVIAVSHLVVQDWPRFITGHGLNMAERAVALGLLPPETPASIVFTLWYELGVVGVAGFAFLMAGVFFAAGDAPPHAAPAILAMLAAGLLIAILGAETTQLWWMTLNGMAAIALALLAKAHGRMKHPPAPAAEEESEMEDPFDLYQLPED